jgi:hypothetical protein
MKRTHSYDESTHKKKSKFIADLPLEIWDNIFFFLIENSRDYEKFLTIFPKQRNHFDSKIFREHVRWDCHFGLRDPLNKFTMERCQNMRKYWIGWCYDDPKYGWNGYVKEIIGQTPQISHLGLCLTEFVQPIVLKNLDYLSIHSSLIDCKVVGPIKKLRIEEINSMHYETTKKSIGWGNENFCCEDVYLRPNRRKCSTSSGVTTNDIAMANDFLNLLEIGKIKKLTLEHWYAESKEFEFEKFFEKVSWKSTFMYPLREYGDEQQKLLLKYEELCKISRRLEKIKGVLK